MPTNITPDASGNTQLIRPLGADALNAASIKAPLQRIANKIERLISRRPQIVEYTTPGDFTFDPADFPGFLALYASCISGGGGGGANGGGGGGSGGFRAGWVRASEISTTAVVRIGEGGAGGTGQLSPASDGSAGGNSEFIIDTRPVIRSVGGQPGTGSDGAGGNGRLGGGNPGEIGCNFLAPDQVTAGDSYTASLAAYNTYGGQDGWSRGSFPGAAGSGISGGIGGGGGAEGSGFGVQLADDGQDGDGGTGGGGGHGYGAGGGGGGNTLGAFYGAGGAGAPGIVQLYIIYSW